MKLDLKTNQYATNATSHGKFKVANNAVMQQILSSMLYSDPIQSVIREISVNAYEAHLDVGCPDKPFDVTLPTFANPQFVVRDYGPGLDKEQLEKLYTTYGLSTKRETNDYTGGFGIGSKSPFAYTDMFYVTSYHKGMKYVVINSKNAKDEFVYDILSETETDEPDGLEVAFDVKQSDIQKFNEKALSVYKWFNTVPNVTPKLTVNKLKILESGDGWGVYQYSAYYYNSNPSYVVAGQVAYPINNEHFKGSAKTVLDRCGIIVYLPVGVVSIAPDREKLQYNKHTIDTITEVLERFYNYTKAKVEKQVANCKSGWEARILARKFFSDNSFIDTILNSKVTFDGKEYSADPNIRGLEDMGLHYFSHDGNGVTESKKRVSIYVCDKAQFAIYEQGAYAGARRYVEANKDVKLYICPEDKKQELIDETGILETDFLDVSAFPPPVKQSRAKSVGNKIQAYRFTKKSHGNWYPRDYWDADEIDLDNETGYYCPILRFKVQGPSNEFSIGYIQDILDGKTVIGVLVSREEKVKNHPNWKNISELLKKELDKLSKSKEVCTYSTIIASTDNKLNYLCDKSDKITNKNSDLYKHLVLMKEAKKAQEVITKFNDLQKYYRFVGGKEYKVTSPSVDLNFSLKKFPLLEWIPYYYVDKQAVIDYVNLLNV